MQYAWCLKQQKSVGQETGLGNRERVTIPAKNRAKLSVIDLNFQIKRMIGLVRKLT